MYNNQEELDRLVETVSRAGVDIAPGYSEYDLIQIYFTPF